MENFRASVREYILENFLQGEASGNLADDMSLKAGIVDSMGTLKLVSYVEEETGIELDPDDVTHFDTVDNIVALVESRGAGEV